MGFYIPETSAAASCATLPIDRSPVRRGETLDPGADLGCWVLPYILLAWVLDEVEKSQRSDRLTLVQSDPEHRPDLLVSVLAFCLGRRIFDRDGIARACRWDPTLQRFCRDHGHFPSAGELERFQRKSRPMLERVLTNVFLRALRHRLHLGGLSMPVQLEEDVRQLAIERLNIARHMDVNE